MGKAILWIVICIMGFLTGMILLQSCSWFQDQGVDQTKITNCTEQCALDYVKGIESIKEEANRDALIEAGIAFSNCMIQCTDAVSTIFDYVNNRDIVTVEK